MNSRSTATNARIAQSPITRTSFEFAVDVGLSLGEVRGVHWRVDGERANMKMCTADSLNYYYYYTKGVLHAMEVPHSAHRPRLISLLEP
jgi:hypothetical protein